MSFNRLKDDPETYNVDQQESRLQGMYQLTNEFRSFIGNCTPFERGTMSNTSISSIVDDESELHNLSRTLTKNPQEEFPFKKMPLKFTPKDTSCNLDGFFDGKFTQMSYIENQQDINVERMDKDTLLTDPQDVEKLPTNTRSGLNTRLYFRDAHPTK
jgi:hypothetical protein